jgi:SAM-dependent methyltransferase
MAPDIALGKITELAAAGDRVLDPMCGSGTVVRLAAAHGCVALGTDLDPLAVLITRTAAIGQWSGSLPDRANAIVARAKRLSAKRPEWIARDPETSDFVDYWFASQQADDLSRLARVLKERPRTDDPLRVALSRLIITKDGGASLARDTAHSRPHRTRISNEYDVFEGFVQAAGWIAKLAADEASEYRPQIRRSDARHLGFIRPASIDLVVTSPPYLNAIDYLRGHRMSLVWFGWTIPDLRTLRGTTVGAERGLAKLSDPLRGLARAGTPLLDELNRRQRRLVYRFTKDAHDFCRAVARVVKPGGTLVLVVADSRLGGIPIANSRICVAAARHHGFSVVNRQVRQIPARHRYLPPPSNASNALDKRMKQETVYTLSRNECRSVS